MPNLTYFPVKETAAKDLYDLGFQGNPLHTCGHLSRQQRQGFDEEDCRGRESTPSANMQRERLLRGESDTVFS